MKNIKTASISLFVGLLGVSYSAHSAIIDMTDGVLEVITPSIYESDEFSTFAGAFRETIDGVNFTFNAVSSSFLPTPSFEIRKRFSEIDENDNYTGSDPFYSGGEYGGFYVSGNTAFTMTSSKDIELNSYFPIHSLDFNVNAGLINFDIYDADSVLLSQGNNMGESFSFKSLSDGPITMLSGMDYLFVFTMLDSTDGPAGGWSKFRKLSFDVLDNPIQTSEVPIPAAWFLFASGMAGFVWVRRKSV